jgi:hypothetical protein
VEEASDMGAGLLDCSAGVLAVLVDGTGVAVVLHPVGTHGLEDLGEKRGRGVGVEVDSVHGSILAVGLVE